MEKLENIGMPEVERLVKDVTNIYLGSATGVIYVIAERNTENKR